MCSAVYPWQEVCSATDVDIRIEVVPYPDHDGGWTQSILQRIDDDVLLVCVPPLHWSDGALVDLDAVGIACRKHGSTLVIDATQGRSSTLMAGNSLFESHNPIHCESCWDHAVQCEQVSTIPSGMQCAQGTHSERNQLGILLVC